ncbi:MAG: magnesium ion transporter [Candelina mexicana]|nr:MAG: magnesium ion transporter [Candelina mexicana]
MQVPAPSSTLLRFLKSQSEAACFFTSNPRPGRSFNNHALQQGHGTSRGSGSIPVRELSRTQRRSASLESSFFNLDPFWPRSKQDTPGSLTPPPPVATRHALQNTSHTSHKRISHNYPDHHYHTSEDQRGWLWRAWGSKRRNEWSRKRDGLPPLPSLIEQDNGEASMFNIGRGLAAKASNELKLRCTEVDGNGVVTLVNGEFRKSELIAKYGLLPRDLRKIDSSLLPHILVRPSAILINLLHLRVLIKYDHVLIFDAYGSTDSYTQSVFMYDLGGKLHQREGSRQAGGLSYEFRALEAVLVSVTSALEGEFEGVREPVVRVLRELEEDIDREKLRYLLIYSKKLGTFEQKAKLVRDAIDELLEADDDLSAMYLTEKAKGIERSEDDHTEVEMLLESYYKICDEIVQASGNLVSNIRNTEEIVKAILDANRNSLMLLDLKFSIGTLGIGSGAFIAALYGMNLKNFMEESDFGFLGVSASSFIFAAIICSYGLTKLRKVQRVSMWGESGRSRRGSWRDVDPMPALPGESRVDRLKRLEESRKYPSRESRAALESLPAAKTEGKPTSDWAKRRENL